LEILTLITICIVNSKFTKCHGSMAAKILVLVSIYIVHISIFWSYFVLLPNFEHIRSIIKIIP
jgi:hypothetical protein